MLHSSLSREVSANTVRVKVYNLIPSPKSLISDTLLDLLHSKFATSQTKSFFSEEKDKLKLDDFYQKQSKLLLEQLLQSPNSGYLSCLTIQDFINQTFPSTDCDFNKFAVMHYHGKEEYSLESVLPRLNPWQDKIVNKLLRSSNITLLRDYNFMQSSNTTENFDEIIPPIVNAKATFNLLSVLDDGRSSSPDNHPQSICLPFLLPPLSGNPTSQRHLRVFQESGLLNFAMNNNGTSDLTVMKSDEFLRRFSVLNHLQCDDEKDLKVLARTLRIGGKILCATNTWKGLKTLPLSRNYFNDCIVKIMENCRLLSDLYFVSPDWVLLTLSAVNHLKLELMKLSMFSRRIQRWWRRRHQQRQMLQDISNFLLTTSVTSANANSNNYSVKTTLSDSIKNVIFPVVNDTRANCAADCDDLHGPVYVVANTVLSNVPVPQSYGLPPQQISPQRVSPTSQKSNSKLKRPPPSSGIAWFEPRYQRPPAFPTVAPKPERVVSFVENSAPRYLSRNQSTSTPHNNEPQETNLRRSSSARAFDIQQQTSYISDAPPAVLTASKDIRPLARSNSSNVGSNFNRENLGGVQRRIRRRTTEMPADLGERRPVSWHVGQMEAQVIAHIEKQKLLNGEVSPVLLRRRNSSAKVSADDQRRRSIPSVHGKYQYAEVKTDASPQQSLSSTCRNEEEDSREKQGTRESRCRDTRRVTSEFPQSRSPYRMRSSNGRAASLAVSCSSPQPTKSPEAQREEFLRVQSEIKRGEYRRSRELTTSPPRQNSHAIRREMTPDIQQNNHSLSSHSTKSCYNSSLYGSIPDFRLFSSDEPNYSQAQPYFTRLDHAERMNGAVSKQPLGVPPNTILKPPHNPPRRRPVSTVFDGPLTPNIFPINLPSRNHSPPREPIRQPRVTFSSSPMDGKVIIPVSGRKSSIPVMPIPARLPVNAYDMDNHGLKSIGGGCIRNFCYD